MLKNVDLNKSGEIIINYQFSRESNDSLLKGIFMLISSESDINKLKELHRLRDELLEGDDCAFDLNCNRGQYE
jgi:hypothetical protein